MTEPRGDLEPVPEALDTNSKRSRVEPIFGWLREHGGSSWPQEFLGLVHGLRVAIDAGELDELRFEKEVTVRPSPERLAWMIRNADRLVPLDGRRVTRAHA